MLDPLEQEVDVTPPGQVVAALVSTERGQIDGHGGDCSDLGHIFVDVEALDDRTLPSELGYVVVDTTVPQPFIVSELASRAGWCVGDPPVPGCERHLFLQWSDHEPFEPLDFELAIAAMDLAGNVGPASTTIHVTHPGVPNPSSSGGCTVSGNGAAASGALLLFALGLVARRRERAGSSTGSASS